MFSLCTVNHASTLHEVEPILTFLRYDYSVSETVFGRTYKSLTPTQEESVAEAVIGDGDVTKAQKWNAVLYLFR